MHIWEHVTPMCFCLITRSSSIWGLKFAHVKHWYHMWMFQNHTNIMWFCENYTCKIQRSEKDLFAFELCTIFTCMWSDCKCNYIWLKKMHEKACKYCITMTSLLLITFYAEFLLCKHCINRNTISNSNTISALNYNCISE